MEVDKEISAKINSYYHARDFHQTCYFLFEFLTFLFLVATPVTLIAGSSIANWIEQTTRLKVTKDELAIVSSLGALVGGLSKKYGWRKHWINNQRTADAIKYQLNLWEVSGHTDERSLTSLLERINQIESKHLDNWEKDIQEPKDS